MKILKWGKIISNTMKVKCKKCGAKLEIGKEDISAENIGEDIACIEYSYQCPCCRRINVLTKLNENLRFVLNIE